MKSVSGEKCVCCGAHLRTTNPASAAQEWTRGPTSLRPSRKRPCSSGWRRQRPVRRRPQARHPRRHRCRRRCQPAGHRRLPKHHRCRPEHRRRLRRPLHHHRCRAHHLRAGPAPQCCPFHRGHRKAAAGTLTEAAATVATAAAATAGMTAQAAAMAAAADAAAMAMAAAAGAHGVAHDALTPRGGVAPPPATRADGQRASRGHPHAWIPSPHGNGRQACRRRCRCRHCWPLRPTRGRAARCRRRRRRYQPTTHALPWSARRWPCRPLCQRTMRMRIAAAASPAAVPAAAPARGAWAAAAAASCGACCGAHLPPTTAAAAAAALAGALPPSSSPNVSADAGDALLHAPGTCCCSSATTATAEAQHDAFECILAGSAKRHSTRCLRGGKGHLTSCLGLAKGRRYHAQAPNARALNTAPGEYEQHVFTLCHLNAAQLRSRPRNASITDTGAGEPLKLGFAKLGQIPNY
eukprot:366067-Chlamydomonas_euryale.AAC.8